MAFPETIFTIRGPRGVGKSAFAETLRGILLFHEHEIVRIDPRVMASLYAAEGAALDVEGAYNLAFDAVKKTLDRPGQSVGVELEGNRGDQVGRYAELARLRGVRFGAVLLTAPEMICRERLTEREGGFGVVTDSEFLPGSAEQYEVVYDTSHHDLLELASNAVLHTHNL